MTHNEAILFLGGFIAGTLNGAAILLLIVLKSEWRKRP